MSYGPTELYENVRDNLKAKGYVVHFGEVDDDGQPVDGAPITNLDEATDYPTGDDIGFWFTWCNGGDVETGPTAGTEEAAWGYALDHFMNNAEIKSEEP